MLDQKTIRKILYSDARGSRLTWRLNEVQFIKRIRIWWGGKHASKCSIDLYETLLKKTHLLSHSREFNTCWIATSAMEEMKLIGSTEIIMNVPDDVVSARAFIELEVEVRPLETRHADSWGQK